MTDTRKPFWAKCGSCSHCWAPVYLPMEMAAAAKLMLRAACPMCGSRKAFVAKQHDGELQESKVEAVQEEFGRLGK